MLAHFSTSDVQSGLEQGSRVIFGSSGYSIRRNKRARVVIALVYCERLSGAEGSAAADRRAAEFASKPLLGARLMVFSYWDSLSEEPVTNERTAFFAWRRKEPRFRVFQDGDVVALLEDIDPDFSLLFRRIRIPACKADIARLVLLWGHGGLYLDAHTGPGPRANWRKFLLKLDDFELVLFDRVYDHTAYNPLKLTNSIIAGRAGAGPLRDLIKQAIVNLQEVATAESRADGRIRYNIYLLTGPRMIRSVFFDEDCRPYRLKPEYEKSVWLEPLPSPRGEDVSFYSHYQYRRLGRHWTERQLTEPLFGRVFEADMR